MDFLPLAIFLPSFSPVETLFFSALHVGSSPVASYVSYPL
jgi:hypothetical protein